jgi:hypothetical protein
MATKKDETEKERRAREAREKAAKKRAFVDFERVPLQQLHKRTSRMQRSDAGDLPELRGSVGSELIQADLGAQPPKTKPKKKRPRPRPPAPPTAAEAVKATRTEGVRMGEFDLDRVESAGKGKPRFAVMVDSKGKEHPVELEPGQKRPSEAQLKELRLKIGAKKKAVAKSEAFTQRVLERKRRHTEKTGSLSKPQHPSKIFVDDPDVKWTKASERGGAAVWKPSKSVGHGPLIKISTDGTVWHGSDKKGWSKLASD